MRPGGSLAVFDGDYATTTVAIGDDDPLQTCVEAMVAHSVTDRWLARRLPALVRACTTSTCRAFAATGSWRRTDATIVDRGVDVLRSSGRIGDDAAAALRHEARRRVERGRFFGHIAYVSLVASRPA